MKSITPLPPAGRKSARRSRAAAWLRLIVVLIVCAAAVRLSTFGWRFHGQADVRPHDDELAERLRAHVIRLSHDIGDRSVFEYAQLNSAAEYISGHFAAQGLEVELQTFSVYGKDVVNIIAHKRGDTRPDEIIVIGAHYDTCFNPGANDNASGVAALIELAAVAARSSSSRTLRFIAFVNEEPPFFKTANMGSLVYAQRARARGDDIRAAIILEMIGCYSSRPFSQRYPLLIGPFFPNRADFIAVVGNFDNRGLVKTVRAGLVAHCDVPVASASLPDFVPGVDFSDHWSFWQCGFPAVMITDTAFYRYEHYHRGSDTYEKLDYPTMAAVVEGLHGVMRDLAMTGQEAFSRVSADSSL